MRHRRVLYTLLGALLVFGTNTHTAMAVEIDQATQARLGLVASALTSRTVPTAQPVAVEVLDPLPLARLVEDTVATETAAAASTAESRRAQALWSADGNMSRKAVDAANAQAAADQSRARQLRAQLRLEWGSAYATLPTAALQQRVTALVEGRAVLLRAQLLGAPSPSGWSPTEAHIVTTSGTTTLAKVLNVLSRTTAGLTVDWLLEAEGKAWVPGMHSTGSLSDLHAQQSGVVLPRSAVVRWNGLSWVYAAIDATHFERRAVTPLQMLDDGWLVGAPFKAGERVVTTGANALLAIDARGAQPADQDHSAADTDD